MSRQGEFPLAGSLLKFLQQPSAGAESAYKDLNPDLHVGERVSYSSHHLLPPVMYVSRKLELGVRAGTGTQVFEYGMSMFHGPSYNP